MQLTDFAGRPCRFRVARFSFAARARNSALSFSSAHLQQDFIDRRTCLLILEFVARHVGFDKHPPQIVQLLANYGPLYLAPATSPSWLPHCHYPQRRSTLLPDEVYARKPRPPRTDRN